MTVNKSLLQNPAMGHPSLRLPLPGPGWPRGCPSGPQWCFGCPGLLAWCLQGLAPWGRPGSLPGSQNAREERVFQEWLAGRDQGQSPFLTFFVRVPCSSGCCLFVTCPELLGSRHRCKLTECQTKAFVGFSHLIGAFLPHLMLLSVLFGEPWWGGRESDCEAVLWPCSHPHVALGTCLTLPGWDVVCETGTYVALCRGVSW